MITLECNNFKRYVNRNENISVYVRDTVKDFIRFVKLLCDAPYKRELTKEVLEKKLNAAKGVQVKSWLSEKINELK